MNRKPSAASMLDFSSRLWFCILAIVTMVGVTLYWRGFDLWTSILICIALICPAIILWGLALIRRESALDKAMMPKKLKAHAIKPDQPPARDVAGTL